MTTKQTVQNAEQAQQQAYQAILNHEADWEAQCAALAAGTPTDVDRLDHEDAEAAYLMTRRQLRREHEEARQALTVARAAHRERQTEIYAPKLKAAVKRHYKALLALQQDARSLQALQNEAGEQGAVLAVNGGYLGQVYSTPLAFRSALNGKVDAWERYMRTEGWLE